MFFNGLIFLTAIATLKLKNASSEVTPHEQFEWHPIKQMSDITGLTNLRKRNTIRRAKKARQRIRSIHQTES
jgi:hypothetical protein